MHSFASLSSNIVNSIRLLYHKNRSPPAIDPSILSIIQPSAFPPTDRRLQNRPYVHPAGPITQRKGKGYPALDNPGRGKPTSRKARRVHPEEIEVDVGAGVYVDVGRIVGVDVGVYVDVGNAVEVGVGVGVDVAVGAGVSVGVGV